MKNDTTSFSGFSFAWRFLILLFTSVCSVHYFCGFVLVSSIAARVRPESLWPRALILVLFLVLCAGFFLLTFRLSRYWNQPFWIRYRFWQLIVVSVVLPAIALTSISPSKFVHTETHVPANLKPNRDFFTLNYTLQEQKFLASQPRHPIVMTIEGKLNDQKLEEVKKTILLQDFERLYWLSDDYTSVVMGIMTLSTIIIWHGPALLGHPRTASNSEPMNPT